MPRLNLPRVSVSLVITDDQYQAILKLADSLEVPASVYGDSAVALIALRDLWAARFPAIPNPFLES